jgi:hypothetical protein
MPVNCQCLSGGGVFLELLRTITKQLTTCGDYEEVCDSVFIGSRETSDFGVEGRDTRAVESRHSP